MRRTLALLALLAGCGGTTSEPGAEDAAIGGGDTLAPTEAAVDAFAETAPSDDGMVAIPAGSFEMGDHSGLGGMDPAHPSDELPLHTVKISAFALGRTEMTVAEYVVFLEATHPAVEAGFVKLGGATLAATREGDPGSRIGYAGGKFSVLDGKDRHPVTTIRWEGAAAYANWLSQKAGLTPCIDLAAGSIDFTRKCYRLPTEAEWEYAAVAGRTTAYPIYAWGDVADKTRGNWPTSGDPFEGGAEPFTTPIGFYDGSLRAKKDYAWPGAAETYQTGDGRNPWGLADLSGNAWEWIADWYRNDYYKVSPSQDPTGPTMAEASKMPDGKPYRGMRGGSWFNGENGHSRVSNRDPSYFRGPGDPNGPWHHVGFRVALAHP